MELSLALAFGLLLFLSIVNLFTISIVWDRLNKISDSFRISDFVDEFHGASTIVHTKVTVLGALLLLGIMVGLRYDEILRAGSWGDWLGWKNLFLGQAEINRPKGFMLADHEGATDLSNVGWSAPPILKTDGESGVGHNEVLSYEPGPLAVFHFLDRLFKPGRLNTKNNRLNDSDKNYGPSQADHPPVGRRLVEFLCLSIGGFLLSLCGWQNLDYKWRLLAPTLIGIGLLLTICGSLLWFITFYRWSWDWWL